MKLKSIFLIFVIFTISLSGLWAVWEGNGGAGAASDFSEKGLFVRSDVFPKHTLIEIINLEKNITAKAIVIAPSGVQGLLLSLSPELAEVLQIPHGRVARIRVSTPSPVKEIGDDGIDIIALTPKEEESPVLPPEPPAAEPQPDPAAYTPPAEPVRTVPPVKNIYLEPSDFKPPKIIEPIKNKPEPPAEPVSPVKDINLPVEPEEEQTHPPGAVENLAEPQQPKKEEERIEAVKQIDIIVPPKKEILDEEESVIEVYGVKESSEKAETPEEETVTELPPVTEPEETESAGINKDEPDIKEAKKEPVTELFTETYPVIEKPVKEDTQETKTEEETVKEDKKYTEKLQKGKYYVQIAVYGDELNVKNIILKYGKTYPIVVEERTKPSGTQYFIFVGPLQEDEIGAAEERFKNFGFKECFLKKGN